MPLRIRELTPDDLEMEVAIRNAANPGEPLTLEAARTFYALEKPGERLLRPLAFEGDRAAAVGTLYRRPSHPPGRASAGIWVHPDHQGRGVAGALYALIVDRARREGLAEIQFSTREDQLPKIGSWLLREGFRESERMRLAELDLRLNNFDDREMTDNLAARGISLTTLGAEDSPENRRKLWELSVITERDIPFTTARQDEPFDRFNDELNTPMCLRDCLVVATHENRNVGFSILGEETEDTAFTWNTGVHPGYRGKGIALAIKTRSARLARERGYRAMRTYNHVNNPAMLAVNARLGYRPLPERIIYVKQL